MRRGARRVGGGRRVGAGAATGAASPHLILLKSVGAVVLLTACIPWLVLDLPPFRHAGDERGAAENVVRPPPPPQRQRHRDLRPPSLTRGGGGGNGNGNRAEEESSRPNNDAAAPNDGDAPSKAAESAPRKKTNDDPNDARPMVHHFVVSSDCSTYQRWQVLTQIHSAVAVRQAGRFTWVVSGCPEGDDGKYEKKQSDGKDATSPEQIKADLAEHFPESQQASLSPITAHFTPDYADMTVYGGPYADGKKKRTFTNRDGKIQYGNYGNHYHFNNKPNGLRHWAEQRYGGSEKAIENEVIILIDPDFLFLKPFELPPDVEVSPGKPAAAHYGLGGQWLDFDLDAICGADSPCTRVTNADINAHYTAGPPYIIHAADVLALSRKWSELVPPTYDQYPLLYAEMYAYSMAAADLSLPHTLVRELFTGCMVRYPQDKKLAGASAKAFVDGGFDLQRPPEGNIGASGCFVGGHVPPVFLHYCRRYAFENPNHHREEEGTAGGGGGGKEGKGEPPYYFFAKRRVPHDILDGECPDGDGGGGGGNENLTPFPSFENERIDGGRMDWTTLTACSVLRAVNYAKRAKCDATK